MKPIHQLLNITQDNYQDRIMSRYIQWCSLNSSDDQDCQKFLANGPIFGWWLQEFRKLERQFREDAEPYIGRADNRIIQQLYIETVLKIRDFYPRALMQTARKTNIVCQLN